MDGELIFDNTKYISSKRASEISGYTQDYVGQLCRDGRVDGRRVGRSWYVHEDSLLLYASAEKKGMSSAEKGVIHNSLIRPAEAVGSDKKPRIIDRATSEASVEHNDDSIVYTNERNDEHFFKGVLLPLAGVTIAVVLVVIVGLVNRGAFDELSVRDLHSPYNGAKSTASAIDAARGVIGDDNAAPERIAYTRLPFFMAGYSVLSSYVQSIDSNIGDGGILGVLSTSTSLLDSDTIGKRGLYVAPSQGLEKDTLIVEQIANTFSDEVVLTPHKGGNSGIIQPIFKNTRGDEYLYVMVPLGD